jgi:hypothetical protein
VAKATAKTAEKTGKPSPLTGHALPVGAHQKNTGGKKGRSGRKPNEFKALVRAIVSSTDTLGAAGAILNNPSNPAWASAFKALAPYAYGQPTQHVAVSGSLDLTTAAATARAKLAKLAAAKPTPDGAS